MVKMKWLNDSLSAYRPPYCLLMLVPGTRREGDCDLNGRPRARAERLNSSERAEAACAACGSRNGWHDAAPTGSGFFVPWKGITMNWQGSSSLGREEAGSKRDSAAGTANRT